MADDTGDSATERMRLLLVHDAESSAKNLNEGDPQASPRHDTDEDDEKHARDLVEGLQASRVPSLVPNVATTDGHRNAAYDGETVPGPRTNTPPVAPSIVLDITEPGRPVIDAHPSAPPESARHDTLKAAVLETTEALAREPSVPTAPSRHRDARREAITVVGPPPWRSRIFAITGGVVLIIALLVLWKILFGHRESELEGVTTVTAAPPVASALTIDSRPSASAAPPFPPIPTNVEAPSAPSASAAPAPPRPSPPRPTTKPSTKPISKPVLPAAPAEQGAPASALPKRETE